MKPSPLPSKLGPEFSTVAARALGASPRRLRAGDLEAPFRGVRMVAGEHEGPDEDRPYRYGRLLRRELALIRALGSRLVEGQFFSHRSAALLWEAPVPFRAAPELHVGVIAPQRAPRISNVRGHRFEPGRMALVEREGLLLTSPAFTFASSGGLSLTGLVALGDHLVRVHRAGYGRPDAGKPPLATIAELRSAVSLGRWRGTPRVREALELVREDSWSPRESSTRVALVRAGLPEPELNIDVFDRRGRFLACVDMAYPRYRIAVEYQGEQHSESFAEDVERIEVLRAEGWEVIQVTKVLERRPALLAARVAQRLRACGWEG